MRKLKYLTILGLLLFLAGCAPEVVRHNESGNEHFGEEAYDEAVSEYRLAQVEEPDYPEPYYNAANAYNRTSELDAVQAQTEQALKTADPTLASQAWYNLGNAYFDQQQWQPAIDAYKEALRLQPDDVEAKHNLELALQNLQQQEQEQQQQEQQQEQEQQQDKNGAGDQDQQSQEQQSDEQQGEEETPTPSPEQSQEQDKQQEQEQQQAQQQQQMLTEEQAMQLLQALLNDSETLQERLQQIYQVPGRTPEEDW